MTSGASDIGTLTPAELETLRKIYDDVYYAWRKETILGLCVYDNEEDRKDKQDLWKKFTAIARRLGIACSCDDAALKVGGKCFCCSQPGGVGR